MNKDNISFIWKDQAKADDCQMIECSYDTYDDFRRDPSGIYVLIKPNFATYKLEVAICDKDHKIIRVFSGQKPQDVYFGILEYEKKHRLKWFTDPVHVAYLGKELKKAEIALVTGNESYFQE